LVSFSTSKDCPSVEIEKGAGGPTEKTGEYILKVDLKGLLALGIDQTEGLHL